MNQHDVIELTLAVSAIALTAFSDPPARNWIVADGYVDAQSSWSGATLPSSGEMAVFSSTDGQSHTVRFPAGGWTDSGIYYRTTRNLTSYDLTFDAIGSWWTFGAGTYPGNWQVFTMCAGDSGTSYPHILEVDIKSATAAKPVFKLTDGVVKLAVNTATGNTLSLERGTWDFTAPDGETTANEAKWLLFKACHGPDEKVILREGTSLRVPTVSMDVGAHATKSTFLVEGGTHRIGTFSVGGNTATTPATLRIEGGTTDVGSLYIGSRSTSDKNHLVVTNGTLRAGTLQLGTATVSGSSGDAVVSAEGSVLAGTLTVASATNSVGSLQVEDYATLEVTNLNIGVTAGSTAMATLGGHSTVRVRQVFMAGDENTAAAPHEAKLELKDDADMTVWGYLLPIRVKNGSSAVSSQVIVGGNAQLKMTATQDGDWSTGGGINLGSVVGGNPDEKVVLQVKDNAVLETAARTTVGHVSSASNVLEICGNATFRNTSESIGLVLGRGKCGRGYLCVRDNAKVELVGDLQLSGNLQWGDNLGGEERVDVLGGSVFSRNGALSLNGTNAWVNLADGSTSFARWIINGDGKYNVADPNWIEHTNTIHVTGGSHVARGYYSEGSIVFEATNSPTRLQIDGGRVQCCGCMIVGRRVVPGGHTPVLAISGGRLAIDKYTNGDSKLFVSNGGSTSGRLEFTGGEIEANCVRGWNGTSTLIADGGTIVALGDPGTDYTVSRFTNARLGARGLTVEVKAGLETAKCNQAFTDLDDAVGLFTKTGKGRLTVNMASQHARTLVGAGRVEFASGIKTFGRRLSIAEGAYVLVSVPAAVGSVDVLTLGTPLTDAELARVRPAEANADYDYVFGQMTVDGVTTVTCTVAANTSTALAVDDDQTFDGPVVVRRGLTVAAGKNVVFNGPVEFVDNYILIDVGVGSTVTFNQPVSSSGVTVEKVGYGRVVFNNENPYLFGTWKQNGGTYDIASPVFAEGSARFDFLKDTLTYSGPSVGTNFAAVAVAGGNAQKRVVVNAVNDVVFAGGWHSTGGGLVKYGPGAMTIVEGSGTSQLNSASVAALGIPIDSLPTDGISPADETATGNGYTAGAALNVLDGALRITGAGTNATIVKCEQGIYVGTGYAAQGSDARLEIVDCDFRADGTARHTSIGYKSTVSACDHPALVVTGSKFTNHRLWLGEKGTTFDLYPTVEMANTTVNTESGFEVGMANDRIHPVMRLANTSVTQYRTGYALGHAFHRDFDVTLQDGSLLNATWTSNAGVNWHGFQFANNSWGTIRVEGGSTLQTSRFEFLGTGTESRHVELVFDDGTLDITSDASGNALSARTEVKSAHDAFVTTGAGFTINVGSGITHTFAAPIKGTGGVRKTGTGTLCLASVVDGGAVTRQSGRFEVAEGTLDLGGETVAVSNLCGCATVANGTLTGSIAVDLGATADEVVQLADTVDFGAIRLNVQGPHETATVGAFVPIARSAADIPANKLEGWRGGFDALADAKSYRIVGKKVENGVVYATIETATGAVIYFR